MDDLQSRYEQYPDWKDKVVLIVASVDDEADLAAKHVTDKKWDKTHNVWVGVDAIKAWHVHSLPTTYVIDQQGNIASYDPEEGIAEAEVVNRLIQRQ